MPRFGSSKGVSSIIGIIFLVLAVFIIADVFVWIMIQNTRYHEAVQEVNQMDVDRFSERVVASHTNFTVPQNDTVQVRVTVSNEGPLSAQVISIWVVWTDGDVTKYGFDDGLDINLNPGDTVSQTISVTVPGAQPAGTFSGWLVTARGNRVSLEREKGVVVAQVSGGIGSITMDFASFKYYEVTGNQLGPPQSGFSVPGDKVIVFSLYLTNLDEHHRNINLTRLSLLWLYPATGAKTARFPIARVVNQTLVDFDFQILEFGKPTKLFFGPDKATEVGGHLCAANLLLYGTIGDEDYGQNIPFVSVYVT